MAHVVEELIVFKVSRLVRKDADGSNAITPDVTDKLVEIIEESLPELTGVEGLIVEVLEE